MINNTEIFFIQDLSLEIDKKLVLDNLNFRMLEGEIVTIIGPNGGGKTSLAKIIVGILSPTKGKISFSKKIKIGYVPQKIDIDKTLPLNVKDFMEFFSNKKYEEIPENLLKFNLPKRIMIDKLSGGELQKLILISTIMSKPDLILLDEPLKGLDIQGQVEFYNLIEEINKVEKISILMISHDLHKVMSKTSQIICLNKHICCTGNASDMISHPEFVRLFGDNNISIYHHHHDHEHPNIFHQ